MFCVSCPCACVSRTGSLSYLASRVVQEYVLELHFCGMECDSGYCAGHSGGRDGTRGGSLGGSGLLVCFGGCYFDNGDCLSSYDPRNFHYCISSHPRFVRNIIMVCKIHQAIQVRCFPEVTVVHT